MLKDWRVIAALMLPGLMIYVGLFIVPIMRTGGLSMTSWGGFGAPEFIGLRNFVTMFTRDSAFLRGVKNTLLLLIVSELGQIPPALVLALILHRLSWGTRVFKTLYFIPVIVSSVAIGLTWQKIYEPNFGVINSFIRAVGLGPGMEQEWLSNPNAAMFAVAVPVIWRSIGYYMIILYAGLKSIPDQYEEAARIDGASYPMAVVRIVLPLLRDVIKVCVVLSAIGSLKIFDMLFVLTEGGPANRTTTVAIRMFKEAFTKFQFGYGSAIAIFLVAECLVIAFVINKLLTRREPIEY